MLKGIPKMNPLTTEYFTWWKQEKRKCIEGVWSGGKWMPGPVYFYINFWKINLLEGAATAQSLSSPLLRDLEWEKGYIFMEARGFSGFVEDDFISCHRLLKQVKEDNVDIELYAPKSKFPNLYRPDGTPKIFQEAREYLRKIHKVSLGKALFENESKNVIDLEGRGCLARGTEVLMFDGTVKVAENINVGDLLMGKDGTARTVQWLHSGVSNMYRITSWRFDDIVVNENHNVSYLYSVYNKKGVRLESRHSSVKELLIKQECSSFKNRCYRYQSDAIPFTKKQLKINPYCLGLWLSKGCSNKHIPLDYKTSSIKQRLLLLAGLIDGDGCYDKAHNTFDIYIGVNKTLANDVLYLVRSLGLYGFLNNRLRKDYKETYKITVSGDIDLIPTKLLCKQAIKPERRVNVKKSPFSIKYEGVGEFFGFHLDGDNEYLLGDFTVDHNTGKSFFAAGAMIGHNFLFDGALDYDMFLDRQLQNKAFKSETIVGAIHTSYSNDLLSKVELGLNEIEGSVMYAGKRYPSPLAKQYDGSFQAGKYIEATMKEKSGGIWTEVGTKSKIHHRPFKDNPEAANGTRPNLVCLEEAGFMGNIKEAWGSIQNCTSVGGISFGTIWAFGTGGKMASGATESMQEIFYDPDAYNCLAFDDIWEGTGKVGMFVPATYALNKYRNEEGVVDLVLAEAEFEQIRKKKKQAKSKEPYNKELENNPLKPSEAFLITEGNFFPTGDLKEQLGFVNASVDHNIKGQIGFLIYDAQGKVQFKPDTQNKLRACGYPVREKDDKEGGVVIWEHPVVIDGSVPFQLYLAGIDPYDQDEAPNSSSLGSTIIYKTFTTEAGVYEWPVAEYTARPNTANEYYENVRKLLMYYNCQALYENERNLLKAYLSQKNSLHLLASTPTILKATRNSNVNRQYGIHMTAAIKDELEIYTRDWLISPAGEGKLNLHKIYSVPLLTELISYNRTGNFDRVIAFMLCILQRNQNHHLKVQDRKVLASNDDFIKRIGSKLFFK